MPHENVWDSTNAHTDENGLPLTQGGQRRAVISWSHGPTPSDEYNEPDGWVQLMTQDGATPARFAADRNETEIQLAKLLKEFTFTEGDQGNLSKPLIEALTVYLAPHLGYAFGDPVGGFAVTLDRSGINRTIRLLQRARTLAYGSDA